MVYTVSAEAGSRDAAKAQITAKFAKVDLKLTAADKALSTAPFKKVSWIQRVYAQACGSWRGPCSNFL